MSLGAGSKLGPYEIEGPLGAGGMGVVWRARDTRLERTVAIKSLPEGFARDPERLARFEREAKLLASLQHPNIGAIYGLEEAGGQRHLVLEYIAGDTLADRLRRGAMPIGEALDACRQIAAALESAHESGVIHRDLKPGNVKLTPAGEIKVLDFGLAKGGVGDASSAGILTQSPTMTLGMTGAGVILGTAAYMSPEQARGRALDRRTDIWSFGCVLYECLTGRPSFEGETVSDLIARILEREPDLSLLPPATPAAVKELLQRCLEKDAKQRLRDIGDARIALEKAIAERTSSARVAAVKPRAALPIPALAIAALAGAAIGIGAWMAFGPAARGAGPSAAVTHVAIDFPEDPRIYVFRAIPGGLIGIGNPAGAGWRQKKLYRRDAGGFDWTEIPGTDGAQTFEVSADGHWLVFRASVSGGTSSDRLARVPVDGSAPPVTITAWDDRWGKFALLESGEVLLVEASGKHMGLLPVRGGEPVVRAIESDSIMGAIREVAAVLPGDRAVLFDADFYRTRGYSIQTVALDPRTARFTRLVEDGGAARYWNGMLFFARGEVLLGAPFDLKKLALTAAPVALERGLRSYGSYIPGDYDLDASGNLYLIPGGDIGSQRRLGIIEADGRVTPLATTPASYRRWPSPSFSGEEFSIQITNAEGIDELWMGALARPGLRRVIAWPSADAAFNSLSFDGQSLAYLRVARDADDGVYVADVRSAGNGRRIVAPESAQVVYRPEAWSPDGRRLVLTRTEGGGEDDLWLADLTATRDSVTRLRRLTNNDYADNASDWSPDGRWLAWCSRASERYEVYVASVSETGEMGAPIRITDDGGEIPEWSEDGRRLVVRREEDLSADIIELGPPPFGGAHPRRIWFVGERLGVVDFGLIPKGRGIAILRGVNERDEIPECRVIQGWGANLKQRLAARR